MLSYKQIFQNRQPGKKPDILESPCYPRLLGYLEIWETFQKETFARFQSHGQHAAGGFIETRNAIDTVVLPAPFGPIIAVISPRLTSKLRSLIATSPPNRIDRCSTARMVSFEPLS